MPGDERMAQEGGMSQFDSSSLTDLVRRVVGSDTAVVESWAGERVSTGLASSTEGIYRLSGTSSDHHQTQSWSTIVKVLRQATDQSNIASPVYWKREALVFQSSHVDNPTVGFVAPRCYGVFERPEEIWLAMEEVTDDIGKPWSLSRRGLAARHLGQFNGQYLVNRPLPADLWLTRDLFRWNLGKVAEDLSMLHSERDHPFFRMCWPGDLRNRVLDLWDGRERYLSILGHLPQVACHGDAHDQNLFARRGSDGHEQTIAIDWAFFGLGSVGEDLAPQLRSQPREAVGLEEIDRTIFGGYLAGLRDVGWHGDSRMARLGFVTSVALRYGIHPLIFRAARDPAYLRRWEESWAMSTAEIGAYVAILTRYALGLAVEATDLGATLDRGDWLVSPVQRSTE
jgi:hypothetical protein